MNVEFSDIKLGDEVTVKMKLYYWLTLIDWINAIDDISDIPNPPAAARMVISDITEAITTEPFRKAWQAQHHEMHEEHPIIRILRMAQEVSRDDDDNGDPRDVGA